MTKNMCLKTYFSYPFIQSMCIKYSHIFRHFVSFGHLVEFFPFTFVTLTTIDHLVLTSHVSPLHNTCHCSHFCCSGYFGNVDPFTTGGLNTRRTAYVYLFTFFFETYFKVWPLFLSIPGNFLITIQKQKYIYCNQKKLSICMKMLYS